VVVVIVAKVSLFTTVLLVTVAMHLPLLASATSVKPVMITICAVPAMTDVLKFMFLITPS
jgi:hypothetical protein